MRTDVSGVVKVGLTMAAVALTGCAQHLMGKSTTIQSCDASARCEIQVDAMVSAGNCVLAAPDVIEVQVTRPAREVRMRWTLNAPHSQFRFKRKHGVHNGILILDNPDDPQFSDEPDSDDRQASWKNQATAPGTFPYKINAQYRSSAGRWTDCPFDPVIVNRE